MSKIFDYKVKIGLVPMRRNTTDRLIDEPYIHHFVEIEGDYRKECKYCPNLRVDLSI